MTGMIRYSRNAFRAVAFLKRHSNDIEIYVEDSTCHNTHLFLLRRILGGDVRLRSVNQVGSRRDVIDLCRTDQAADGRRRLYIIDGDFEFVVGRRRPQLRNLYRLRCYCVENLLLSEDAIVALCAEADSNRREEDIRNDWSFPQWIDASCRSLSSLFIIYAVSHALATGLQTVAYSVHRLCDNRRGLEVVGERVLVRMVSLIQAIVAHSGREAFLAALVMVKTNATRNSITSHQMISGKDYLIHLAYTRAQARHGYRGTLDQFKTALAARADPRIEPYLGRALRRALRG